VSQSEWACLGHRYLRCRCRQVPAANGQAGSGTRGVSKQSLPVASVRLSQQMLHCFSSVASSFPTEGM
jgi:hypothetical protein